MTMSKVGVAALKARLSEHLRAVRSGRSVTIVDRATPIARLVPYEEHAMEMRKALGRIRDLRLPPAPKAATDSLSVLLDDRRRR
jgi:prevent-host-death family protein